jgi:outer membrane protein assembly factor BamB
LIISTKKSLLNYDVITSEKKWNLTAEPNFKPIVTSGHTYVILKNNLLLCLENSTGNVIWSKNIFRNIEEKKIEKKFKLVIDFKIVNNQINIYSKNGYLLSFNSKNGKLNYLSRISKNGINSKIFFLNDNMFFVNNSNKLLKSKISKTDIIFCGKQTIEVNTFEEKLPNGKTHNTVYLKNYSFQDSDVFIVPIKYYFFLGDNRDCSKDSRYLTSVGYVHEDNLVGKAQFIFFSSDFRIGSIFSFWKWHKTIRFDRFFKRIN